MADQRAIGVLLHDFELGGSERVAIRLANAWAKSGRRTILYVGNASGPQKRLVDAGVEIESPPHSIVRGKNSAKRLAGWVAGRVRQDGTVTIFLPGNSYFKAARPFILATNGCVPLYATISNILWRPERSLGRNIIFAAITRWRLRHAQAVIPMSDILAAEARRILGRAVYMHTIPNAVFDSLPVQAETLRVARQICAVGRLERQKNFSLLLKSVAQMKDMSVTLKIAGDGSLRAALEREAIALDIADRVEFLGTIENVHSCMARSELLMLTSEFEGYPSVVVEALAAGTFVIARNCSPAMPELLHSPGMGTIVSGSNPADFAAAARKFFKDPCRDMAAMKAIAVKHVAESVARQYLELFDSLPSSERIL